MVKLTCKCCGFSAEFSCYHEAYLAGWDEPESMPSWPVSCPLCPGVASLGMLDHSAAHERWAREGRPASFEASMNAGDVPLDPELRAGLDGIKEAFAGGAD